MLPQSQARAFLFIRMAQCPCTQSTLQWSGRFEDGRISVDAFLEQVRQRRGSQLIKPTSEWGIGCVSPQTSKVVGPRFPSLPLYLQSYIILRRRVNSTLLAFSIFSSYGFKGGSTHSLINSCTCSGARLRPQSRNCLTIPNQGSIKLNVNMSLVG